ncbi:MAG: GGDEF domain-containing protein [Desulfobacter sp.]|nr:GGDEF domain-containing protein [Desulfobacter sp.]
MIQKYLEEIRDKYGFFSSFFVSDISLNYYHFNGILKKISTDDDHDVWYYQFKDKQKDHDLVVDTNEAEQNHLTIFINHRLIGYEGQFWGVVGVGLDFNRVATLLEEYRKKYNRNIYMVDPAGMIMVHKDKSKINTLSIHQVPGLKKVAPKILNTYDKPAFFEYDKENQHILLTTRFVRELGWFLMVEQDETQALSPIKAALYQNLGFSIATTLLTIAFVFLVINFFQKRLEAMAITDPLTRAFNRNEFEQRFKYMTEMNRRTRENICIVLFDLDHLKAVNDTLGHLMGDQVIKKVAQIASKTIRDQDMLVRWGGDEFVLLIKNNLEISCRVAERLRQAVESHDFYASVNAKKLPEKVTISCGIAKYQTGQSLDDILHRADRAMYRGKEKNRNVVVVDKD